MDKLIWDPRFKTKQNKKNRFRAVSRWPNTVSQSRARIIQHASHHSHEHSHRPKAHLDEARPQMKTLCLGYTALQCPWGLPLTEVPPQMSFLQRSSLSCCTQSKTTNPHLFALLSLVELSQPDTARKTPLFTGLMIIFAATVWTDWTGCHGYRVPTA